MSKKIIKIDPITNQQNKNAKVANHHLMDITSYLLLSSCLFLKNRSFYKVYRHYPQKVNSITIVSTHTFLSLSRNLAKLSIVRHLLNKSDKLLETFTMENLIAFPVSYYV